MASGQFFGGIASGFQRQEAITNAANYQQGLLKLEQQRLQQQQNQQIQAQIDDAKTALFKHIDDDKVAPRTGGAYDPKAGYMSISRNVDGIADLITKTQGQQMADIFRAQVAAAVNGPSSASVKRGEAAATGELQLRQSEVAKNQAQTKVLNQSATSPDVGGGDDNKLLTSLATRAGMTPEELDVMGQARAAGNMSVLQNLGRGKQGGEAVKAVNAWAVHSLMQGGLSAAEAAAKLNDNTMQFGANKVGRAAGARTAAQREANLSIILDTAGSAVDAAVAASDALPRGQFVPANQAIQAAQKAGSSPELKVFAQKNLQLAELWAKSMNPTGTMRESDRELALSILSTADSQETYRAAANAIKASIGLEKGAAIKFLKDRGLSSAETEKADSGITVHGFTFTPSQ